MGRWGKLPAEIRWMIFEILAKSHSYKTEPYARAGYATVDREWQRFFEPLNFQRLVVDQDRLDDLDKFTAKGYRRCDVKHIWLRVRLDEYDCTVCQVEEDAATMNRNNLTFTYAVCGLMDILSTWPGPGEGQGGLTFELSAFSPSDSKHAFKDFRLEQSYSCQRKRDIDPNFDAYRLRADRHKLEGTLDDPEHGWINGHCETTKLGSKRRLMGRLLFKNDLWISSRKVPKVGIITGLLIRRQFHRKIPARLIAGLIHEVCTSIQRFRHEGWYDVGSHEPSPRQVLYEEAYLRLLFKKPLPDTLREMHLFEDFNKTLHPERDTKLSDRYRGQSKAVQLGLEATCLSKSLEKFSASFFIDARDFFIRFYTGRPRVSPNPQAHEPWKNLRNLALTSCLLSVKAPRGGEISRLLIAAGRAAALMPRLETMEIWNGGEGHICIFRYTNLDGQRNISWRSSWSSQRRNPNMHHLANTWEQTLGLAPNTIKVEVSRVRQKKSSIETHISAIRRLKLRNVVLHPVSLHQLVWEAERTKLELPEI